MTSSELRKAFLEFFEKNGHVVVPSSSLLPDDPSVLLTTAGMQQFKPYYTGEADPLKSPHPTLQGKPLKTKSATSIQKSFRTSDIDEVGDETHLTFFEMLGNFSFGGYFKEKAIKLAYDFLKEIGLEIQYVTIFKGDKEVLKDEESKKIWQELGIKDIREENREENFWGPTGNEGPCGPTTEIYIGNTEIWNIVFNEYYCNPAKTLKKLDTPGVDTGMGLERLAMVIQGKKNIFETDLFFKITSKLPDGMENKTKRIMADHVRAIAFLISDGVRPSNKEAGYVLRRLMRRVLVYEYLNKEKNLHIPELLKKAIVLYDGFYPELQYGTVLSEFEKEQKKFQATLGRGMKELNAQKTIDAPLAFKLYESFGLPYEIVKEVGGKKAEGLTREEFDKEFARHQETSRAGRERKFGGHGLLLDTGELKAANEEEVKIATRLHTATHLLQAALRKVLGDKVKQAGSDITAERTRFDFTFDRKVATDELKKVEDLVNEVIQKDMSVEYKEIPYEKAIRTGALYSQKEKHPPVVKVYAVTDKKTGEVFSRELCGGPHVSHTREIETFRIVKEESVAAGIRRIRAKVA